MSKAKKRDKRYEPARRVTTAGPLSAREALQLQRRLLLGGLTASKTQNLPVSQVIRALLPSSDLPNSVQVSLTDHELAACQFHS
jgi:hypothetical protein